MLINNDLTLRAVEYTKNRKWSESPAPGVWRIKLDSHGEETGRATSLVKFDPGSSFTEHSHPNGEEIFVIEGRLCHLCKNGIFSI